MKWSKIKEHENYSASENGDIRNDKTGRMLKQHINTSGYNCLDIGRRNPKYVHRLVLSAFVDNVNNLPQVDHINGDKLDNRLCNLRWVTVSENRLAYGFEERAENLKKKIKAINKEEEIIFDSRNSVAEYFKCNKSCIKYNWLYKKGNKKGWIFKLVEDMV